MRICISVQVLVLIKVFSIPVQGVQYSIAIASALSGSDICYSGYWFNSRNPATLASWQTNAFGISYQNLYFIPGLSTQSLSGTIASEGTWGYSLDYFGTHALNESCLSLSYGRKIFRRFDLGISMKAHSLSVEALSERSYAVSCDIGLIMRLQREVSLGVHLVNPNRSVYFTTDEEALSAQTNLGLAYHPGNIFYLAIQAHWLNYSAFFLSVGSEYRIGRTLALQAGIKVGFSTGYSWGILIDFRQVSLALGFEQHACLGITSAVTVCYKLSRYADQD